MAVSGAKVEGEEAPRAFRLVEAWDGYITKVDSETLVIRIVPLDGRGLEEDAEFLRTDIPDEDQPLVQVGGLVYWFVGYETERGRRRRTSELKMRRVNLETAPSDAWLARVESIVTPADASEPTEG